MFSSAPKSNLGWHEHKCSYCFLWDKTRVNWLLFRFGRHHSDRSNVATITHAHHAASYYHLQPFNLVSQFRQLSLFNVCVCVCVNIHFEWLNIEINYQFMERSIATWSVFVCLTRQKSLVGRHHSLYKRTNIKMIILEGKIQLIFWCASIWGRYSLFCVFVQTLIWCETHRSATFNANNRYHV